MKTKELIRQLQEADPSGELECCIDNNDILFVHVYPAFYDGTLEVLIRNSNGQAAGGILRRVGKKVRIHYLGLEDAVLDWDSRPPEGSTQTFPIEIEAGDEASRQRLEQEVQRWRDAAKSERESQRK